MVDFSSPLVPDKDLTAQPVIVLVDRDLPGFQQRSFLGILRLEFPCELIKLFLEVFPGFRINLLDTVLYFPNGLFCRL